MAHSHAHAHSQAHSVSRMKQESEQIPGAGVGAGGRGSGSGGVAAGGAAAGALPHSASALALQEHTIILIQPSSSQSSRTFLDYDTVAEGIDGLCSLFERRLKETNPTMRNITYDIGDLYRFVDALPDVSALVFDPSINAYVPYDRNWLKEKAYAHLSKLAGL